MEKGRHAGWMAVAALALSTLLMWLPARHTPFWGDDYVFLLKAHAANLSTAPWWSDFWPQTPVRFWRPLSQEGYWRLMDVLFGGSAFAMHAASLFLHALASAGVGVFAWALAHACRWRHVTRTAVLAGVLYASLAMHMLPVHWAAAANNSMLTLFTALALAAWVAAFRLGGARRVLVLGGIPVLLAMALLTKESAVLIPLLMVVAGLFTGAPFWRPGHVVTLVACAAIIAIWLVLDARFTARTEAAYTLEVGRNVLRNGASFAAWLLNVPREALRMALVGNRWLALGWVAATALPMLGAWYVAGWRGRRQLSRFQWLGVMVFAGLAYGPYFLFSWNSYAYYAAVAAILPVVVLARLGMDGKRVWGMVVLVALSSWVAVAGTRHAPRPALIARAQWGENMLRQLEAQPVRTPFWVAVSDRHRFYAVGQAGLAWCLHLGPGATRLATQCPASSRRCLVIDRMGHWHWRQSKPRQRHGGNAPACQCSSQH